MCLHSVTFAIYTWGKCKTWRPAQTERTDRVRRQVGRQIDNAFIKSTMYSICQPEFIALFHYPPLSVPVGQPPKYTVHTSTASNTPGINFGKVKKGRKNTQLEKYLLAWAAERSAHWYCWPVNCVLLKQVQSQGSLQGSHCPPTFVLLFNTSLQNRFETSFSFPIASYSKSLLFIIMTSTDYNCSNALCLSIST